MKVLSILIIGATIALSSCSSAYRTAQTPDDVYYSPGKQAAYSTNNSNNNNGEYYNANPNDQYLMMKAQDPTRWSTFDDYSYDGFYSPYYNYSPYFNFGDGLGFYSPFSPFMTFGYWGNYYSYMNSYYMWNTFYNPYYYGVIVVNPKYPSYYNAYAGLHPFNVNAYRNGINSNTNSGRFYTPTRPGFTRNSYNNHPFSNQGINSNNNNNNRSFSQPTRTYAPSSSFGSGGGSRGGGGGFSRPGKG